MRPERYLMKHLPEGSFLDLYIKDRSHQETALLYDIWGGLWALSTILGRRVWCRPGAVVYPNLYVIFVAESGVTRKGPNIKASRKLVEELVNDAVMVTGKGTPEYIEQALVDATQRNGHAQIIFSVEEGVILFGREKYMQHLPGLLTDIFDCPDTRRSGMTLGRHEEGHKYEARKVYSTLLTASTPAWLYKAINPTVIAGGFTSRCLFIYADQPKKLVAWPDPETVVHGEDRRLGIVESLGRVQRAAKKVPNGGRLSITPTAKARFERWYRKRVCQVDAYTQSFMSREDRHVLAVAMILAANNDNWVIGATELNVAIALVEQAKELGKQLFVVSRDIGPLADGIDKLIQLLIGYGTKGAAQHEITKQLQAHLKAPDIKLILSVLHEMKMVQMFIIQGSHRPRTQWRATKSIMTHDISEIVSKIQERSEQ